MLHYQKDQIRPAYYKAESDDGSWVVVTTTDNVDPNDVMEFARSIHAVQKDGEGNEVFVIQFTTSTLGALGAHEFTELALRRSLNPPRYID